VMLVHSNCLCILRSVVETGHKVDGLSTSVAIQRPYRRSRGLPGACSRLLSAEPEGHRDGFGLPDQHPVVLSSSPPRNGRPLHEVSSMK